MDNIQSPRKSDHVPLSRRIGWGFGGIAENFMANTLFALGMIIYTTAFYIPAGIAGLALFVPRLFDAITDPLIGNLSDNFRSRWGRRRPLMFVGVLGCVVILPLMWFPPDLHTAEVQPWGVFENPFVLKNWFTFRYNGPFWYIAVLGSIYFLFYTLFMVPYTALGFELTPDYDERTRVIAWRMYLGLAASMSIPSLYWFCRQDVFGDGVQGEINGARFVSIVVAMVILLTGLIPVFATREPKEVERQPPINIVSAVKSTLSNKPFLVLFIAYIAVIMGIFTAGTVGQFALIYYVFQTAASVDAAKDHASFLGLVMGVLAALTSYASMYLISRLSMLTGKKHGMILGLFLMLAGTLAIWYLYDPNARLNVAGREILLSWGVKESIAIALVPGVLLATLVGALGGQGCWLMIDSMTADICDEDELQTGLRREGMFSAVQGFARKIAFAFTVLVGGYLIQWIGFDPEAAEKAGGLSKEMSQRMLIMLMVCQGGGLALAILVFFFYPITRERAERTRAELEQRRGAVNPLQ
ncbi:MAG: MFS transporter [Planctomycetota bacterium]